MGVKIRKLRGKWYLVIDYRGKRKTRVSGLTARLPRRYGARLKQSSPLVISESSIDHRIG
jgi:hypothetical protein